MIVETNWYDNRGKEDLANLDFDRFAIPLKEARQLDRIRAVMSERAGREVRIEEIMKAALTQFIDANAALLGKPVAQPPTLPADADYIKRKAREQYLGMLPG